jgi:hypothetical protein
VVLEELETMQAVAGLADSGQELDLQFLHGLI